MLQGPLKVEIGFCFIKAREPNGWELFNGSKSQELRRLTFVFYKLLTLPLPLTSKLRPKPFVFPNTVP